ncbi:hypothetical protein Csa_007446, partial [Cucumis sativus]
PCPNHVQTKPHPKLKSLSSSEPRSMPLASPLVSRRMSSIEAEPLLSPLFRSSRVKLKLPFSSQLAEFALFKPTIQANSSSLLAKQASAPSPLAEILSYF